MDIHSLRIDKTGGSSERISAQVFGTEIHFEVTGSPLSLRRSYDPFVLAGFFEALKRGQALSVAVDAPVSSRLLANLEKAMAVYAQWCPGTTPVPILTENRAVASDVGNGTVGVFFSGGVDSIYSFIENEEKITHLVLCRGLDIPTREGERWQQTVELTRAFAEERNRGLVLVETNVKEHLQEQLEVDNHGAILVCTALPIPFDQLIVPASATMRLLLPWGSHPLLDPLFSNGVTEVVHDSVIPRNSKIEAIVKTGIGLDCLRVCNVFTRQVNCGCCEKCLRTRTAFSLLGRASPHLPLLEDPKALRSIRIPDDGFHNAWSDNLMLSQRVGRRDFEREIRRILRRYRFLRSVRQLDQDYLRGALIKAKRFLRPS